MLAYPKLLLDLLQLSDQEFWRLCYNLLIDCGDSVTRPPPSRPSCTEQSGHALRVVDSDCVSSCRCPASSCGRGGVSQKGRADLPAAVPQLSQRGRLQGRPSAQTRARIEEAGVVVPGDPGSSHLFKMIAWQEGKRPEMPKDADPLTEEEIVAIRGWIVSGAKWPRLPQTQLKVKGGSG